MSLFSVSKDKVIASCNNAITYFKKEEARIKDLYINAKMNRKWFKPQTREEAWEMVRKEYYGSSGAMLTPHPPWFIGCESVEKAQLLLKACKIAEGYSVQLNIEDASFIEKWNY